MDFSEALKLMKQGKKLTRPRNMQPMKHKPWIFSIECGQLVNVGTPGYSSPMADMDIQEIMAEDWEIVE